MEKSTQETFDTSHETLSLQTFEEVSPEEGVAQLQVEGVRCAAVQLGGKLYFVGLNSLQHKVRECEGKVGLVLMVGPPAYMHTHTIRNYMVQYIQSCS